MDNNDLEAMGITNQSKKQFNINSNKELKKELKNNGEFISSKETIKIKSENILKNILNTKKFSIILCIFFILLILGATLYKNIDIKIDNLYEEMDSFFFYGSEYVELRNEVSENYRRKDILEFFFYTLIVITALLVFIKLYTSSIEIVVTDKRIYGKTTFGRRVDLPFNMISSLGTCWFNGIKIGTSSGKINFLLIKQRNEVHTTISKLLINKQSTNTDNSNVNILKEYKELLDNGIITQEEFELKKKQILDI